MAKPILCLLSLFALLCIAFVHGHVAVTSPNPKIPGFNADGFCGGDPSTLPAFGLDNAGNSILQNAVGGTKFTFGYSLAHNFESLQSGRLLIGSNYVGFATSYTLLVDGVSYTEGAQNTLSVNLPLNELPQASISVFSDELGYGGCVDFAIRCPIGTQSTNCATVNETAIAYLAGLQKTDPTAFQNAISELNDPNLATVKASVLSEVNSYNSSPGVSSGGAIAISIFVIAFVGIIAGTLYYRHKDPEGFAMKMSAAKEHIGNAWDATKSKLGGSGSSGSSRLPTTRPYTTPDSTTKPVAIQPTAAKFTAPRPTPPSNIAATPTPSRPARPTPPPAAATSPNRATPPPKQGGSKAPSPPTEEIQNANDYKYTPPAKELPSKPLPPPKRTTNNTGNT